MRRVVHICQSVDGALRNWGKAEWKHVAKENGRSPEYIRKQFEIYKFEGKKVIPIGPMCDGFDFEKGCPGHEVTDEEARFIETPRTIP